jgi:hypothetical protein
VYRRVPLEGEAESDGGDVIEARTNALIDQLNGLEVGLHEGQITQEEWSLRSSLTILAAIGAAYAIGIECCACGEEWTTYLPKVRSRWSAPQGSSKGG